MSKSAFVLGGTGQIGVATATALLDRGWRVRLASRSGAIPRALSAIPGIEAVVLDREQPGALGRVLGGGADLLIDTIAFDEPHAEQLLAVAADVGAIVAISSASVYCDALGRTLDEAAVHGSPELPEPITEQQATVPPGAATYSTRKSRMEHRLLDRAALPVAVLRPCAIHGVNSRHPREWWFVRRLLDGRTRIPLAWNGLSRFQTTATSNIAGLIAAWATAPETVVLNVADADTPNVSEIGRTIMAALGRDAELVPLSPADSTSGVGRTPWSAPRPFVLCGAAGRRTGFVPESYAATVAAACRWLVEEAPGARWPEVFPALAAYPWALFDYAAEDIALGRP